MATTAEMIVYGSHTNLNISSKKPADKWEPIVCGDNQIRIKGEPGCQ
jgi:hypothetical protein